MEDVTRTVCRRVVLRRPPRRSTMCRRPQRRHGHARFSPEDGFSLMELLVVLAIVALVGAIAVPNLSGLVGSAALATERERILNQFASLGVEAMQQNRSFAVLGTDVADPPPHPDEFEPYQFPLPEGWEVRVEEPILVRANGVCGGGRVTLRHADAPPVEFELTPPLCRVPL